MRSDVVFDSLYLDRCLRSGWYLDIIMLLLLGVVYLMFRSDSAVFGLPGSCTWWWMIWCHLIFLIYHIFDVILGHIPFRARSIDLQGVACLSPLARCTLKWLIGSLFYDDPSVEPLWSHSVRPTFLDIWLSPCFLSWETFPSCLNLIWITEVTCSMIDDSMSPGFWPTLHSMPYWGIFSTWTRFINLHGVTWSLPLVGCTPRRGRVRYLIMISWDWNSMSP